MRKADDYFYKTVKQILDEGNFTTDNSQVVRPILLSSNEAAHSTFITNFFEEYDLTKNEFPVILARPISVMAGIREILWIWQDQTSDLEVLRQKYRVNWWDQWDNGDNTIGERYGAVVKRYGFVDKLITKLKETPNDRNLVFSLNQEECLKSPAKLNSCAYEVAFNVRKGKYLDMHLNIRSNDYLVAGHINRMQYVALQMMIAQCTGYVPGKFTVMTYNLHIYHNQSEQMTELIGRYEQVKQRSKYENVILKLNPEVTDFYEFTIHDFTLENYDPVTPQIDSIELAV